MILHLHRMKNLFLSIFFVGSFYVNYAQQQIISGSAVAPPNYEWMAGLSYSYDPYDQFCGGALIAPDWIATAAHCMEGETVSGIKIFFNAYYLSQPVTGYFTADIDTFYIHENFNNTTYDNDIALIHLRIPVTAVPPIRIARTAETELVDSGKVQKVIGWGKLKKFAQGGSDTLMEAEVPIVAQSICNAPNSYDGEITNNMLCAGFMAGGSDACQGDSGGPLFSVDSNGNEVLTGIVSWGNGCGDKNFPGIYTKIQNYLPWIEDFTGKLSKINSIEANNTKVYFSNNVLNVSSKSLLQKIEIADATGRIVEQFQSFDSNNIQVPFHHANGMYFAKIFSNHLSQTTKVFVHQ